MTDRSEAQNSVPFTFDGHRMLGTPGEPLARALFRNGVRTLSRSVKYDRPRGIYCARGRCVACLVEVDGRPAVKACLEPLRDGMAVRRQDRRPFFAPALTTAVRLFNFPAGFYFRFFTRPAFVRRAFLGTLRRMAGVSRIPPTTDPPTPGAVPARVPTATAARAGVLVVGSGVSGLAAAAAAAAAGATVVVLDAYDRAGGHAVGFHADPSVGARRDQQLAAATASPRITLRLETAALGFYDDNTLLVGPAHGGGLSRLRAGAVVFATGTNDAIPLFENNDTPGILGAQAARLLLERDQWRPGRRAIVYGTATDAASLAALLHHHGIDVVALAVPESTADPGTPVGRVIPAATLRSARGRGWITGASFDTATGRVSVSGDLLCIATPGQPAYELPHQAGFQYRLSDPRDPFAVLTPTADRVDRGDVRCFLAGSAAGVLGWSERIEQAAAAGRAAAEVEAARHHG